VITFTVICFHFSI